jgi:hypothetical protein
MPPQPVTAAVIRPHQLSGWFVLLGSTITKPGRYYINRVIIDCTIAGHRFWQYRYLHTTFHIKAARPRAKPVAGEC